MPNIRLFLKKITESESLTLESEKTHYLKRVMRKKMMTKITVFNGKEEWEAKLNLTESNILPQKKTANWILFQIFICILVC